jgi:nucleoside-diphosphate-sugar epimerase
MGTLWGAAPNFRTDLVVNRFAIEAIKNKEIKPLSNSKRPLLHVNDAAEAFVTAGLANREQYSGIFNVNGENVEIFDVAKRVGAAYNVPVIIDESQAGADQRSYHIGTFQTPHLCPSSPTLVGDEKAMKQLEYSATAFQDKPTRLEELVRMLDTGGSEE